VEISGAPQVGKYTGDRVAVPHLSIAGGDNEDELGRRTVEEVSEGLGGRGVAPVASSRRT
jgi:hypothetical protein